MAHPCRLCFFVLAVIQLAQLFQESQEGFLIGRPKIQHACQARHLTWRKAQAPSKEPTPGGVLNRQITGSASVADMLDVLHAERNNPAFDMLIVGAAWCTMARLQRSITREVAEDPYLDELIAQTLGVLRRSLASNPTACSRECANMFWAMAKLQGQRLLAPHLAQVQGEFSQAVIVTAYYMKAQEVANIIWGCSQLKLLKATLQRVMQASTYRLRDVASELKPQEASNILLAAAKLGRAAPQLLEQMELLAEVMPGKIPNMETQHLANSIWAIATLERQKTGEALLVLLPKLARQAEAVTSNLKAQETANIIWAVATFKLPPKELLQLMPALTQRADEIMSDLNSQNVANIIWAASKLQEKTPSLIEFLPKLTRRAKEVIPEMKDQEVASTILAIGQLPNDMVVLTRLLAPLIKHFTSILKSSNTQAMSNACLGLALHAFADSWASAQKMFLMFLQIKFAEHQNIGTSMNSWRANLFWRSTSLRTAASWIRWQQSWWQEPVEWIENPWSLTCRRSSFPSLCLKSQAWSEKQICDSLALG